MKSVLLLLLCPSSYGMRAYNDYIPGKTLANGEASSKVVIETPPLNCKIWFNFDSSNSERLLCSKTSPSDVYFCSADLAFVDQFSKTDVSQLSSSQCVETFDEDEVPSNSKVSHVPLKVSPKPPVNQVLGGKLKSYMGKVPMDKCGVWFDGCNKCERSSLHEDFKCGTNICEAIQLPRCIQALEAKAHDKFCEGSRTQLCRMLCHNEPECGEDECVMREDSCCSFSCQKREQTLKAKKFKKPLHNANSFCADSPAQLCRMKCPPPPSCGEGECLFRKNACCDYECKATPAENELLAKSSSGVFDPTSDDVGWDNDSVYKTCSGGLLVFVAGFLVYFALSRRTWALRHYGTEYQPVNGK